VTGMVAATVADTGNMEEVVVAVDMVAADTEVVTAMVVADTVATAAAMEDISDTMLFQCDPSITSTL